MLQILIADDHEVVRRGVRALLESRPGWQVCVEASDGREAVEWAATLQPDIAVLDAFMPGLDGLAAARGIRERSPRTRICVFTMYETDELVSDALAAGARAYVIKTDPSRHLLAAVEALARHGTYLTPSLSDALADRILTGRGWANGSLRSLLTIREREVLRLLAVGHSNKEVGGSLGISVKTVESHRANIMRKLEITSIAGLVRYAVRNKLVSA